MMDQQQTEQRLSDDEVRRILSATGASSIDTVDTVQSLWSGYGHILRIFLHHDTNAGLKKRSTNLNSVMLKRIQLPSDPVHPRGWHSDIATQRKIDSYRVEQQWYEQYSQRCKPLCDVAALYDSHTFDHQVWLLLEDLDAGYPRRHQRLNVEEMRACTAMASPVPRSPSG